MSDKGKEQWAKVPFNVSHNILGCDVVFGDGTTARLGRQDVTRKYSNRFEQVRRPIWAKCLRSSCRKPTLANRV